jgi:hypothetical protein
LASGNEEDQVAVNDVVDLLRMLRRENGAELERSAGPEAITVVQEMDGVIRDRLRQSDMYFSLWDEFDQDPDSNRAELIGAIEAAVEGDAEFSVRLENLEEDYNSLVVEESGIGETADAGVLVSGHLEGDSALIGEDGSALTAGQVQDEQGGELVASQGDWGGETMISQGRDASPLTDGETIGGNAYVFEQLLPDEDREDAGLRPGSLYDSPGDSERQTAGLTTADIRSLIQPVEMALDGSLEIGERDRNLLLERLRWVEEELQKGQALDVEQLRGDLIYVRDAAPDLWEMLAWNLRDVGDMLPVSAQSVVDEIAGPRSRQEN